MEHTGWKKWEIALAISLCITLGWGLIFGETRCCAWWGVMYPELTQAAGGTAQTFAAAGPDRVVLRSQLWAWLTEHVFPALRK